MQMDIRIAIFEDNKLFRNALQNIINITPGYSCCAAFEHANNVAYDIGGCKPDVVLMDIEMPGTIGIDATRQIKVQFPTVKVLIQTVFDDSERIFQAMCAGASGYILKNDPPEKYIESIREV